jgi:hypothetical protein
MSAQQKRVLKVLDRMKQLVKDAKNNADAFSDMLEDSLDELAGLDFFGTEQQSDPRGDFRNGNWSMTCVEGVDNSRHRDTEEE